MNFIQFAAMLLGVSFAAVIFIWLLYSGKLDRLDKWLEDKLG